MEIVTAHKGKAHVTAEKMAELNRGIVGAESYVMDGGRQFESELVSNNLLKIYDGSGMMQGRHICIPVGQSDELTIENGNQGMKRIDLVVVRYTKDENTKIENAETIVIKGTPSESDPVVPAHIDGDIRSGDMTVDWPFYEVELDGISVVEVRPLFKILMNMSEIEKMLTELNGKSIQYYKEGTRNCVRIPINNDSGIQICFGSVSANVTLNAQMGLYTGTATVNHEFLKPFKNISSLQLDNGSYDWIWTVAKSCSNEKISSITFAWLEKYTNKNIYMDYIAIGTY